jgi:hypothetical protein
LPITRIVRALRSTSSALTPTSSDTRTSVSRNVSRIARSRIPSHRLVSGFLISARSCSSVKVWMMTCGTFGISKSAVMFSGIRPFLCPNRLNVFSVWA